MQIRRFGPVVFLLVFFINAGLNAQVLHHAIAGAGGNSQSSGGSISYTAGQVVYTTHSVTGGSLAQGIQQPYEVSVVSGMEDTFALSLFMEVNPNPSDGIVKLRMSSSGPVQSMKLSYCILDIHGRIRSNGRIADSETEIVMTNMAPGVYFLRVSEDYRDIRVFKIIKNQTK